MEQFQIWNSMNFYLNFVANQELGSINNIFYNYSTAWMEF